MGVKQSKGCDWEGEKEWAALGSYYRCLSQESIIMQMFSQGMRVQTGVRGGADSSRAE